MRKLSNNAKEIHTDSEIALQNGGWNYRRLVEPVATSADLNAKDKILADEEHDSLAYVRQDDMSIKRDICRDDMNTKKDICRDVLIIKKEVPEFGTYRVEVTITARKESLENLTLFAGRRNMIDRGITIPKGTSYKKTFYQAVTPYIPALSSKRNNDKCIFVSVAGQVNSNDTGINVGDRDTDINQAPSNEISVIVVKEEVPVIWIAGDSTLTDQNAGIPYYPYGSCAGWAQILARYAEKVAVCNLAHSGMTTNCFRQDGHYAIFQEFAKHGDFFIMQFGHNDQKRRNLAAYGGYAENLRQYTKEVRQIGVEPIICSPISRIPLELTENEAKELSMAKHYSLLQEYADASKSVAKELKAPFVDLHELTFRKWIELGEGTRDYFMPGDITHTNEYGAVLIAGYFVRSVVKENVHIANFLRKDNSITDSKFLPDSDTKELPAEYPPSSPFEIEPPYIDLEDTTQAEREGIRKAFKYGLLDPCVMFIHPHDTMPRGQLLMVMFNAFRMAGVRPYKKNYPDIKVDEWISGYVQAMINEGYLDKNLAAFRPDDSLTFGELADFLKKRYEDLRNLTCLKSKVEDTNAKTAGTIAEVQIVADTPMTRAEVYTTLANFMDMVKELTGAIKQELPEDAEVHPVH